MALTQQDKEEMYQYIVSRGQSIAGLPEGEATLTNKYLGPVIEYGSGGASGRLVRLAVSLLQGKPAVLRNEGGLIQWAIQGTNAWETLADVSELKGENGKNPVFRKNGANLEYKIDGTPDTAYQTLVALSEITGPEGDHIVLEVRDGAIMYKQSKAPDSDFQTVFFLADVKGDKGDTGPAPVLEFGTVTTVEPSEPATAVWVENGVDASGAKKYQLNLSIPKGRDGADGLGSGNVSVPPAALKAGVTYLFKPSADGSAEGEFIEYAAPTQVQSDWSTTDTGLPSFIQNKPSSFTPAAHTHTKADISDFPASMPASDVHDWAKQPSKPSYNASEVGAAPSNHTHDYIPITGTNNLRGSLSFTDPGTPNFRGIEGVVGSNDFWRVMGSASETNAGCLEIATADDGNEPIYVTQYTGRFTTVRRTATLLDAAGNTNFPGTVTSGGQALVRTDDARLSNARPANGGTADFATRLHPSNERPNYGTGLIFNQAQNIAGNPNNAWYSNLRMLHANAAGYFQELAFRFDGDEHPWYRRMNAGTLSNWEQLAFVSDLPGLATASANGLMAAADKAKIDRLQRYASTTTCNALNVDYEIHYVNLSANATLSVSASGTAYNGRTITAFVYCAAARTIAIPTTGSYISMCGSSYTCPAGKWVEFNLVCVNGIWHIAKLEQE